ncbi:diaminopimelate epimerase [Salisediminibacterium beveridgei]|uniref:Diaminopimelate epimerase n=1 Tax=Salisediminibacterium beveridgei TaxID=632773 RepID=A0A1D7QU73_9BACI|nr:diaminopimelate epimerase [Salisediminibacterium beveridgei]AOM82539.1 Diaminopimelate epimerase [Salisediminibacterium beveridgei]
MKGVEKMELEMIKCHGSGNDFIIIDEINGHVVDSEEERVSLSQILCDRNGPVGSDGILFVQESEACDARMRMFNTDGSEAEMCGNGLRCVARYAVEKTGRTQLVIETMKANLSVRQTEELYPGLATFEVAIEPVSLNPATLPLKTMDNPHIEAPITDLDPTLAFTALSVPNPHVVATVNQVPYPDAEKIGRRANEMKNLFPNGVNVSFMKTLGKNRIFVQTYERGVGLTNACGTAMSASSLVSVLTSGNETGEVISVFNPGGMVQTLIDFEDDTYRIKLRGNATYDYRASIHVSLNDRSVKVDSQNVNEDEQRLYEKVAEDAARLAESAI